MSELSGLQQKLGYVFSDEDLLRRALTHRSIRSCNNERLEFLGDAVLSLVMAEMLFRRYPELDEGELSRVRSGLVNGAMLAQIGRSLEVGMYLFLGHGEVKSGGRGRDSILADAVEALIAAVYIESGLEAVRQVILNLFDAEALDQLKKVSLKKDPKSTLQEWLQAHRFPLPQYECEAKGKAHEQLFEVTCAVAGLPHKTSAQHMTRRKAEQLAAEAFLALVLEEPDSNGHQHE